MVMSSNNKVQTKETRDEEPAKSPGMMNLDDLTFDPDDPNFAHQEDVQAVYEAYNILPPGWSKHDKEGDPPYVHEDGRTSWKHPSPIREIVRDAQKEERKKRAESNKVEQLRRPDPPQLKKLQRMIKSGVPVVAVEAQARREGIDPALLHGNSEVDGGGETLKTESRKQERLGPNNSSEVEKPDGNEHDLFRYSKDTGGEEQVEFLADLTKNSRGTHIATLVRRLIQTVRKRGGSTRLNHRGSYLTVDVKDLHNALGAFRGVQHSRDLYNSTLQSDKDMTQNEIMSKRKPFLEQLSSLGIRPPQNRNECVDIEGLDDLVSLIEKHHEAENSVIQDNIRVGMYDFNSLAEVYKPGDRVVAKNSFSSGVDMICEVSWTRYEEGKTLFGVTKYFKVCFQFIVGVGEHFTMCEFVEGMESFDGRRSVFGLPFIPLAAFGNDAVERLNAEFGRRGKMYSRCATSAHFLAYTEGSFYAKGGRGESHTAALRTNGRVMVDIQGSYDAGHSLSVGYDPMITAIKYKYKEYMLHMRRLKQASGTSSTGGTTSVDPSDDSMILFDTVPLDYLEMTWPAAVGFSFTSKTWGDVLIDGLSDIEFQEAIFDSLVLPPARKRMIKALVRHSSDSFSDIVSGKGEGSVFLLYGSPGTGKTLTAEAISEMLHRPLYSVSLGQLGTTPAELETKLGEILDLCGKWDALILLDEADIFLEKRTSGGSLERNAMVSVMLRLVEYFKGVLFLTSNRVDSLDPAFKTRITLALRYDALDHDARHQVWRNLLIASGLGTSIDDGSIEPQKLAAHELNGREIKNAIRLAMALAKEDEKSLSQDVILETVEILCDFNDKMNSAEAY